MVALARLAQDLLGTGTQVYGAAVGPTTPIASMSVFVGSGAIYQMAPLEPSAWSSLAADSTSILKQGILGSAGVTIACPAPLTSGQSINYLIEGQFQELDTNPLTLSYYNADNPQQPFSGAGNNGLAQPTIRSGQFAVQSVAGTAATTGSQTTPAVTSGWTAIAVVTVAQGATTIVSGNIAQLAGIQPSGSFTMTASGFSSTVTGTVNYRISGPIATLIMPSSGFFGTSDLDIFAAANLPGFLQPAATAPTNQFLPVIAQDNGSYITAAALITAGSSIVIFEKNGSSVGWTTSGTKGVNGNLSYLLY